MESRGLRHSPSSNVHKPGSVVCTDVSSVHGLFKCGCPKIEGKHEHFTMCQILRVRVCISFPVLHSSHRTSHGDAAIDVLVHELELLLLGKFSDVSTGMMFTCMEHGLGQRLVRDLVLTVAYCASVPTPTWWMCYPGELDFFFHPNSSRYRG